MTTTLPSSTVILDNAYIRDDVGRITAITGVSSADSWTYDYDELDRLVEADNAGGNMLDETFTYDANGNMTGDGSRLLQWDEANRLSQVTVLPSTVTGFAYGPDGTRVEKAATATTWRYPTPDVEIESPNGGSDSRVHYPHADIKLVDGVKQYLHRDHLASVRHVTDASGALVEGTNYAAYAQNDTVNKAHKNGHAASPQTDRGGGVSPSDKGGESPAEINAETQNEDEGKEFDLAQIIQGRLQNDVKGSLARHQALQDHLRSLGVRNLPAGFSLRVGRGLKNIVKQSRYNINRRNELGILGKVNSRINGVYTEREVNAMIKGFVGPEASATVGKNFTGYLSKSGRTYARSAAPKKGVDRRTGIAYSKTGYVANFEVRDPITGNVLSNVHVDVRVK